MEQIDEETLQELEAKHGEVLRLRVGKHEAVFRGPDRDIWRRWMTEIGDERTKAYAPDALVIACCVWPDKARFQAMLAAKPALSTTFAGPLQEFAGLARAEVVKK